MIEAGTTMSCIRFNDIDSNEILDRYDTTEKGPLTLKFDTTTWPFLKIDMRHCPPPPPPPVKGDRDERRILSDLYVNQANCILLF